MFSYDGLRLITSGEDDQMVLYDCEKGVERQVIRSQKYGCDLVRFTHATNTIVYASNKDTKEHDIRYMSLIQIQLFLQTGRVHLKEPGVG